MKIMINGYEVEIKAKFTLNGKIDDARFNKQDTMAVINQLCIWASESAQRYEMVGLNALARVAKEDYQAMSGELVARGYYN